MTAAAAMIARDGTFPLTSRAGCETRAEHEGREERAAFRLGWGFARLPRTLVYMTQRDQRAIVVDRREFEVLFVVDISETKEYLECVRQKARRHGIRL